MASCGDPARLYDAFIEPLCSGLRDIGLSLCPPREGMRVLDLGCGTGSYLLRYQQAGCEVCGVDRSAEMLHRARQKLGPGARLVLGDAIHAPWGNSSFDLVLISMVIHEITQEARLLLLREARRLTRRSGRLLVTDYHPGPLRPTKGWFFRGLTFAIERMAGGDHYANYRQFMPTGGIPALLDEAGLKLVQQKLVSGGNMGLYLAER